MIIIINCYYSDYYNGLLLLILLFILQLLISFRISATDDSAGSERAREYHEGSLCAALPKPGVVARVSV